MSVLNEVTDYLLSKIRSVNPNNPKANTGAAYLRDKFDDEQISRLVDISLQIIQMQFTKSSLETAPGEARLTTVSSGIGHRIVDKTEERGIFTQWELEVRVGDLFVEAYYNCKLVDLYYPQTSNSFHIVTVTNRWPLLEDIPAETVINNIKGTVHEKPIPISSMMQQHTHELESIIKNKTEDDPIELDTPWVRSIDKLQQTGWRIDNRILSVLHQFKPSSEPEDNDAKEKKRRSKIIEWTFINRKAEYLRDKTFYQFIEADYRGRLYYSEPFLNFQGPDLSRGLLKFARSKPMDQYGLFWLAVHTACSYNQSYGMDELPEWAEKYREYLLDEGLESISVDKMTLEDRVRWTNENMSWIRKAGEEIEVFHHAEKPVSFLACCLEFHDYHEAVNSNQIFRTSLPIPIDGSNNGWQHLGAISKDPKTGILVGLIPTDIQKDFYVQTAKELYNLTTDERLKGLLDSMPMKHIRKGISKRGSMTRAYSAGAEKIGENMWFDCKTEDYHDTYGITKEDCMALAKILVKAINNVCPGPLKTMGYMQALAGVAISQGKDVLTWSTPSLFPVEYSCYYSKKCMTKGTIAGYDKYNKMCRVNHVAQVYTDFPDVRGFMCGISPNYIHSMDAAHMALVIDQWNGDFGAVHDSFSTHAPDVELLLAHTKQEFIDIYDVENFYTRIEDELVEDMADVTIDRPELGTLNIQEIEDSDYFFA